MIGQYLDQLDELGEQLDAPVIKGETTVKERERLFEAFRTGEIDAAGGQQGRQLLHRPARGQRSPSRCRARSAPARRRPSGSAGCCAPRRDGRTAHFYAVVARDTVDKDFAAHRQRFLAEQGYAYRIVDADDLQAEPTADAGPHSAVAGLTRGRGRKRRDGDKPQRNRTPNSAYSAAEVTVSQPTPAKTPPGGLSGTVVERGAAGVGARGAGGRGARRPGSGSPSIVVGAGDGRSQAPACPSSTTY